ncbi:MAG: tetratricopeptide repeat protein, partial [Planctomycetota bacterium]
RRNALGEGHPDYANSLVALSSAYCAMGDFSRAVPHSEQALEIYREVLSEDHPYFAVGLGQLATLYLLTGELDRAEPLIVQALAIRKKTFGEHHPLYAASLDELAQQYRLMGEYSRAEPLFLQALEILRGSVGDQHPDYASCLGSLATLYQAMGEFARAEPLALEAVRVRVAAAAQVVPALADAQARSWMRKHEPRVDQLLTCLRRRPQRDPLLAYDVVWATKGLSRRVRVGRSAPNVVSPETKELFAGCAIRESSWPDSFPRLPHLIRPRPSFKM